MNVMLPMQIPDNVPFKNMFGGLRNKGVTNNQVAALLRCSNGTARNKLHGRTEISIDEALLIRETWFSGIPFEWLFQR